MIIKIKETKILFIILGVIISVLKLYLLYFNPRPLNSFITGGSSFNYFNTQSFFFDTKSYYDAHIGTPVYIIGYVILKITGNQIQDFFKYFYLQNFFLLLIKLIFLKNFIYFFNKYIIILNIKNKNAIT